MKDYEWNKQYENATLRLIQKKDACAYFEQNFVQPDDEVCYYTGDDTKYEKSQIIKFVENSISNKHHYLFILVKENQIIGECVLNDFDWQQQSANIRIAIFVKKYRGLGYGSWMMKQVCQYAFNNLSLQMLTLGVFTMNRRAIHIYEKIGFQKTKQPEEVIVYKGEQFIEIQMSYHKQ